MTSLVTSLAFFGDFFGEVFGDFFGEVFGEDFGDRGIAALEMPQGGIEMEKMGGSIGIPWMETTAENKKRCEVKCNKRQDLLWTWFS